MRPSTKHILLAGVSILALGVMTRPVLAQVVINTTGTTTEPGIVNTSVNFAADGAYALTRATGGSTITSATTDTNNSGTLLMGNTGGGNVVSSIGASGFALSALELTAGGLTDTTSGVFVNAITLNGNSVLRNAGSVTSATTQFLGSGGLIMITGAGTTFAGDIITTGGGSTGYGVIQALASGINFTGQLGSSTTDRLFNISLYNTGTTTASNIMNVYQVGFAQDGTLSMTKATGGSNITRVDITTDHTGTLNLNNTSGTNTFGTIGATGERIAALNIGSGGASGGTTSVTGDTFADAMTITGSSQLTSAGNVTTTTTAFTAAGILEMVGANKTLAGTISTAGGGAGGFGTIKVSGTGTTLSGQIGTSSANRLATLNINNTGTTTASNFVYVNTVNFAQNGTLALSTPGNNSTITAVTTATDGTGTLTMTPSGNNGVNIGSIGASGHALGTLDMGGFGGAVVSGDTYVNAITFSSSDGQLDPSGNLYAGTTTFTSANGGMVYMMGANKTMTGNVVTTGCGTTGCGNIGSYAGGVTFSDQLGSSATDKLWRLFLYNTGAITASDVVDVNLLNFGLDGTINLTNATGGSDVTTAYSSTNNTGTLNISNTSGTNTFESMGTSGHVINNLNITGNGGTTNVTEDVLVTNTTIATGATLKVGGNATTTTSFTGNGTLEMTGSNKTLNGNVVTAGGGANGHGTIKVSGTGTTLSGFLGTSSANRLQDLQIANAGTTSAINLINTANLSFLMNGTLAMTKADAGSNIAAVTAATDNTGSLTMSNTGGSNSFGTIGASGQRIQNMTLTGMNGQADVTGDMYVTNTSLAHGTGFNTTGDVNSAITLAGSSFFLLNGNDTTLTGSVTGAGNNQGVLEVHGAGVTVNGPVGNASGGALNVVYIANTGTTTFTDALHAGALGFTQDGTLTMTSLTGGSAVSSVNTSTDNIGTLNIGNTSGTNSFSQIGDAGGGVHRLKALNITGSGGTAEINDDIFVTNTTIGSGSILRVGVTGKTFTGAIANNGTFALGSNTVTVDGNITGTNGTFTTTIDGASSGNIINTSNTTNATFLAGLSVTPTVSGGVTINNQDKIVLVHGNTGVAAVDPSAISTVPSSGLLRWSLSAGTAGTDFYGNAFSAQDLVLTASRFVISEISGVNTSVMPVIGNLDSYTGSNTDVLALQSELQNLTTGAELNKAGAQLAPQTNDGDRSATIEAVRTALNTLSVREETLRGAQAEKKGIASGEALSGSGVWTQGFGSLVNEGLRKGVNGYDAATGGAAFGADVRLLKNLRAGGLVAYANTKVDETGDRKGSGLGINSYIGTLYGTYTGTPWYVDGALTMGYHDYLSTRLVDSLGTPQTAKGSYIGKQYGASAEVGYPIQVLQAILTPLATLAYSFLDQSGYTENGAPGANLTVKDKHADSIRSGLGAKMSGTMGTKGSWKFVPSARAAWMHEFNTNAPSTTSSYAGGSSFTTQGVQLAKEAGIMGLGLEAKSESGLSLSAKYDTEIRDQFLGHNFMVQLRQEF